MSDQDPGKKADEASTKAENDRRQRAVLIQVLMRHPTHLRLFDLVCEVNADAAEIEQRDDIECAVHDLVEDGLLNCEGELVVPTDAALRCDAFLRG